MDIAALCALWQQRLRLQDWQVTVVLVAPGTLSGPDVHGSITWKVNSKSARISIVESADMAQHDPDYDQENTLVHELLHVHLIEWATSEDDHTDTAREQAIWAITHALLAGYRRGDTPHVESQSKTAGRAAR